MTAVHESHDVMHDGHRTLILRLTSRLAATARGSFGFGGANLLRAPEK